MKHSLKITLILLLFFLLTQILGLYLINSDISINFDNNGKTVINHSDTVIGARPDYNAQTSFISIIFAILIGTVLALLLIRFNLMFIWNIWFFIAVLISMALALGVIMPSFLAFGISFILTLLKTFKLNIFTHNLSEMLIYPGIALLFVPMLDLFWIFVLLIIISIYDMYAVWKSKHMIKLAEFQSKSHKFAGLMIPYHKIYHHKKISSKRKKEEKMAVLGGGDIFFPLLFSGVVMERLIVINGLSRLSSLFSTLIVTVFITFSLFFLFYHGKKDRYYPAMPFLTAGCVAGYFVLKMFLFFM